MEAAIQVPGVGKVDAYEITLQERRGRTMSPSSVMIPRRILTKAACSDGSRGAREQHA